MVFSYFWPLCSFGQFFRLLFSPGIMLTSPFFFRSFVFVWWRGDFNLFINSILSFVDGGRGGRIFCFFSIPLIFYCGRFSVFPVGFTSTFLFQRPPPKDRVFSSPVHPPYPSESLCHQDIVWLKRFTLLCVFYNVVLPFSYFYSGLSYFLTYIWMAGLFWRLDLLSPLLLFLRPLRLSSSVLSFPVTCPPLEFLLAVIFARVLFFAFSLAVCFVVCLTSLFQSVALSSFLFFFFSFVSLFFLRLVLGSPLFAVIFLVVEFLCGLHTRSFSLFSPNFITPCFFSVFVDV